MAIIEAEGKRVVRTVSEKDKGIYDAYNKGLALVTGDVIGFLNSDDYYCSDVVIQHVMQVFEDPSVEACYADLVYVDREDTQKVTRHWKSRSYTADLFKNAFVPAHPTLFLRKSVYEKAGGFDLSYRLAADYEFMLRIFHKLNVKSVYIPKIIVKMRNGGATGESFGSIRKQNAEILRAFGKHGVKCSRVNFFLRKLADRVGQRVRARFVNLDRLAG